MKLSNYFPNNSWRDLLKDEFDKPYWARLEYHLNEGGAWYPGPEQIFRALELTPPERVKVVILGQDPYQRVGLANGLAFSVNEGLPRHRFPPSLKNILKEAGIKQPANGSLQPWAEQGVLLLNTALTVESNSAASHIDLWRPFTTAVLNSLLCRPLTYLLWGAEAQKYSYLVGPYSKALKAAHPCRASAHRGFLGCGHFAATKDLVDWSL